MEAAWPGLWALSLAALAAGFASGAHCIGMCGGIVGAPPEWPRQLAFNAGRMTSYAAAGALVGSLGGVGAWVAGALPVQTGSSWRRTRCSC